MLCLCMGFNRDLLLCWTLNNSKDMMFVGLEYSKEMVFRKCSCDCVPTMTFDPILICNFP